MEKRTSPLSRYAARLFRLGLTMQRSTGKEYIYALYFEDYPSKEQLQLGPVDEVFYIGRTNDLDRRLSEHRSSAKRGTEAKYVFIRELEAQNKEWDIKKLIEVEAGDHRPHERLAIVEQLRQGANLKNMRQGDLSQHLDGISMGQLRKLADDTSVRTIEDLMAAETRIREAARATSSRDSGEAVLRTQIKGIETLLRKAPRRRETKKVGDVVQHYTVYDMGEGQPSVWAEVGVSLKDIAQLIAPVTRTMLDKLSADFPPLAKGSQRTV